MRKIPVTYYREIKPDEGFIVDSDNSELVKTEKIPLTSVMFVNNIVYVMEVWS